MLAGLLELRSATGILFALGADVVDVLLVRRHVLDVVLEEDALAGVAAGRRILQELLDAVGMLPVRMHALLQHRAERREELLVLLALLLQVLEGREDLRGDGRLDLRDDSIVLQHFARDIERQVGRVNHAFHEAEPRRQQHLDVVADEDVADIEGESALLVRHEEVHRRLLRQEEERLELDSAFAGERDRLGRALVVVREVLVELLVLLRLNVLLRALPEGDHGVQGLLLTRLTRLLVLVLLVRRHIDRAEGDGIGDEVGVLLHEVGDAPVIEVLGLVLAEVQHDRRAEVFARGIRDRIAAAHVGLPHERRGRAALLRDDTDLVRHHECRVEADAELTDQLGQSLTALLLQRLAERLGAGACDGAEVLLEIRRVHADAVVRDHHRLRGLIDGDLDAPGRIVRDKLLLREPEILRAVDCVRRVGDELTQEDLLLRVKGIHHEIEHFRDLGLELICLRFHSAHIIAQGNANGACAGNK